MAASRSEDANVGRNNISITPARDKGIEISAFRLEFRRLNQLHFFTGWRFQPSENISQWEGLSHILWKNKKCSKPPTSFITTDISFVLKQPKKSTTIQRLEGEIRGFIEGVAEFHQALLSADHGDGTPARCRGGQGILSMASGNLT